MKGLRKILCGLLVTCSFVLMGQYTSPFNGAEVSTKTSGYSFIVSGHFYGDSGNKSRFPANTLLANMPVFNDSSVSMVVCLGDLFKDISNDIPNYKTFFFDQLRPPLVNAVGNHDLTGTVYQDNYGATSFLFEVNHDLHVVLDTERDNGDIKGDQLELLKTAAEKINAGGMHNLFVYSHRTVWKDAYEEMDGLFIDNTQSLTGTNFESDVLPLIKSISEKVKVFWFSGSLGTAPASFFYFDDTENGLTIIGTAIRALPRDAVLKVNVDDRTVGFETISLTGQELEELQHYNIDFWQKEVGAEPFNWKLIPYYMELTVTHRYFWYGIIVSVLGLLGFNFIRKRRKKGRRLNLFKLLQS